MLLVLSVVLAGATRPLRAAGLNLKAVAEGFTSPVVLASLADGSGRLLLVDQIGTVHVLNTDGSLADTLFLDLRSRMTKLNEGFDERGVLGLALHPDFRNNRKFYVYYSAPLRQGAPSDWDHTSHLSEFKVTTDNFAKADHDSERVLLQLDQPYFNHNGGRLAFGPDGHLYIALGDGGNANDVGRGHSEMGNGQDLSVLLGKILRIDVNKGEPYGIPGDNPFREGKGRPEIFAYGLRNPWGISFDRGGTHEMFAADVGQTMYEEVNLITKGGNYGWNIREGNACFDPQNPKQPPENCPDKAANGDPLLGPVMVYKNKNGFRRDDDAHGISVTGGYVYRGKAIPSLQGKYIYADWSGNWALPDGVLLAGTRGSSSGDAAGDWTVAPLALADQPNGRLPAYVVALAEDEAGEIYLLTNGRNSLAGKTGKVHKLVME